MTVAPKLVNATDDLMAISPCSDEPLRCGIRRVLQDQWLMAAVILVTAMTVRLGVHLYNPLPTESFIYHGPPLSDGGSYTSKALRPLKPKFRKVIETGRANAVAVLESESQRVLATLQSISPGWHRILEAGGLVLLLPSNIES